jgi:hypothetical protein
MGGQKNRFAGLMRYRAREVVECGGQKSGGKRRGEILVGKILGTKRWATKKSVRWFDASPYAESYEEQNYLSANGHLYFIFLSPIVLSFSLSLS